MSLSKHVEGDYLALKRKLDSFDANVIKKRIVSHDHSYVNVKNQSEANKKTKRKCCARLCDNTNDRSRLFTFPSVFKTVNGKKAESPENIER